MVEFDKAEMIDGDGFQKIAEDLGIVYCDVHNLSDFIGNNRFVLAHNSDGCILPAGKVLDRMGVVRDCDYNWGNVPIGLEYLFAINVDVDDDRIVPLPVGLERVRWFPELRKRDTMLELMKGKHQPDKLVYLNVDPRTNIYSRPQLIKMMITKPWCSVVVGRNGSGFAEYASQIRRHKFVFSPDGNSFEGHRTWEALYLGAIPIVERHIFMEQFAEHLPILIVDKWDDVTEEYLNEKYDEFISREWNWNLLNLSYWREVIKIAVGMKV